MRFSLVRRSSSVETTDDDRRMTRSHHATAVGWTLTPRDGQQQSKQITHLAEIRLSANENRSSAASDVATSQQEII